MSCTRVFRTRGFSAAALIAGLWTASAAMGQVRINEVVREVRDTPGSGTLAGDGGREFIELYNPTAAPIDISGWGIRYTILGTAASNGYVLPAGQSIPANGYYVIHRAGDEANLNIPGGVPTFAVTGNAANAELFPDAGSVINGAGLSIALTGADLTTVHDAVAFEMYTAVLLSGGVYNVTVSSATKLTNQPAGEAAFSGPGYWGSAFSMINSTPAADTNHNANYEVFSFSRWRDGVTTNSTGRDFGFLPVSAGKTNNVPIKDWHEVPNVDGLTANHPFVTDYLHDFIGARAIDPAVVSAFNPTAIPSSPQGGKVIVAWDQTGGGNAIRSKDIVRGFDIDVYLDATPLAHTATGEQEWEHTIYGIGTTDPWANSPNPLGTINASGTPSPLAPATHSQNGSTGIGWLYQRHEGVGATNPTAKLALVDFGDGGESNDSSQWDVLEEITLAPGNTGWHRLSISYDETTGAVTAIFGNQTYNHTIETDLYGQFYVGYREGLTNHVGIAAPPIFDMRAPAVEDADFDGDGDVDGADFLTWQRNVSIDDGSANPADGDANGDGKVNGADLAIWKAQHPATTAAAAPVPEPATWAMALVAGIACLTVAAPRRRAALAAISK